MKQLLGGRMNRAVYWLSMAVLIAIFVVLNFILHARMPINEIMLLFIGVPRLHDLGRTGWWMAAVFPIEAAGVTLSLALLSPDDALIGLGATTLLLFAAMAVIGLIPGQTTENRFGAPPSPGLALRRPT